MMQDEINCRGLAPEEIQEAIDSKAQLKNFDHMEWPEARKQLILKITQLIVEMGDLEFAVEILKCIKQQCPELLEKVMTS